MSKRLDQYLVEKGFAETRSRAQDAIKDGRVHINDKVITKNAFSVDENDIVNYLDQEHAFASRAGKKLDAALTSFQIDLQKRIVIDVGASTGGFSDVCLQRDAAFVYAVDVGKDQLLERLRLHPKLKNMEGVNCRYLTDDMFPLLPSFACIDVSFISLKLILPALFRVLEKPFDIVALIKPQFEAGSKDVGKHGIVKDWKVHVRVLQEIHTFVEDAGYHVAHLEASSILGRDGNKEFVMHITDTAKPVVFSYKDIVKNY